MRKWQKTLFVLAFGVATSMASIGFIIPAFEANAAVISRSHTITCRPAGCAGTSNNTGRRANTTGSVPHNASPPTVSVRARLSHATATISTSAWSTSAVTATASTAWHVSAHTLFFSNGDVVHGSPR